MTIHQTHEQGVSTIALDFPKQNLLTIDIIDQIIEAHQAADAREDTRVILTTSALPGVFSLGLDPGYVLAKTDEERVDIFRAIGRMLNRLFTLRKPHVSRINGPAIAGGAILAITSDYRIFDAEGGRISFSETKVGLPIPEPVIAVIAQCCNAKALREVTMLAKNLYAAAALECGIADAVAPTDQLDAVTAKFIERLVRLSPAVLAATKQALRTRTAKLTLPFENSDPAFDAFVGDDFLGEGLRALVEQRFPNFPR